MFRIFRIFFLFAILSPINAFAATIVVTTPDPSVVQDGYCSIQEAVENANNNILAHPDCLVAGSGWWPAAIDEIHFNIPEDVFGPGPYEIYSSFLSEINIGDALIINGETQPGAYCWDETDAEHPRNLLIILNNLNFEIFSAAKHVTIKGFAMYQTGDVGVQPSIAIHQHASHIKVECNNIGTDVTGHVSMGGFAWSPSIYEKLGSIYLDINAQHVTIGGPTKAQMNVLSGSPLNGVGMHGSADLKIQGNHIGVDLEGDDPLPNKKNGIYVEKSFRTTIGGLNPGEENIIAFNEKHGIHLDHMFDNQHILRNKIYKNERLGINVQSLELEGNCNQSYNDQNDNDLDIYMNYPDIGSVLVDESASEMTIDFSLDVKSSETNQYRVEFFANPSGFDTCSEEGFGEGEIFLGAATVMSDNLPGVTTHQAVLEIPEGMDLVDIKNISSTATEVLSGESPQDYVFGSTSEFSSVFQDVVFSIPTDYGDAPDTGPGASAWNYKTTKQDGGAAHAFVEGMPFLGSCVDADSGYQQNFSATADDGVFGVDYMGQCRRGEDDEDGVVFPPFAIVPGIQYSVSIYTTGNGYVHGWMDWNKDGDWEDEGEKIINNAYMVNGLGASFLFTVPAPLPSNGNVYARFRITGKSSSTLQPTGAVKGGEVEDYVMNITNTLTGDGGSDRSTQKWSPTRNDKR